ncbi:hypothetical protein ACLOJK_015899 [Asimina triloba]
MEVLWTVGMKMGRGPPADQAAVKTLPVFRSLRCRSSIVYRRGQIDSAVPAMPCHPLPSTESASRRGRWVPLPQTLLPYLAIRRCRIWTVVDGFVLTVVLLSSIRHHGGRSRRCRLGRRRRHGGRSCPPGRRSPFVLVWEEDLTGLLASVRRPGRRSRRQMAAGLGKKLEH